MTSAPEQGNPPGKGKLWWKKLDSEERFAAIGPYFVDGWPNTNIENELGLSTGTVAGMKRRWLERKAKQVPAKKPVKTKTPSTEIETPVEELGVSSKQKLSEVEKRWGASWPWDFNPKATAPTEAKQCTEDVDGKQCARVRLPGFDKCFEHV